MKVLVYPADRHGCGHHRLIWPTEILRSRGHDVSVIDPSARGISMVVEGDTVKSVNFPEADVIVLQRVTHSYLAQAIPMFQKKGVKIVVDIDDDLTAIHPDNPSFWRLHPRNFGRVMENGKKHLHSWRFLNEACKQADLVTISTPLLASKYASHGRYSVLYNYLAPHYYNVEHIDSDVIGWPASIHSHPNDPDTVGSAIARLVSQGNQFLHFGDNLRTEKAFNLLPGSAKSQVGINLYDWPTTMAKEIGIGIAPLADTSFNHAKSWLKPLEMSAVGIPWVGSPRTEYARLANRGCGILVDRPKEWFKKLNQFSKNPSMRQEYSEMGREVSKSLRLEDHAEEWLEAWSRTLV